MRHAAPGERLPPAAGPAPASRRTLVRRLIRPRSPGRTRGPGPSSGPDGGENPGGPGGRAAAEPGERFCPAPSRATSRAFPGDHAASVARPPVPVRAPGTACALPTAHALGTAHVRATVRVPATTPVPATAQQRSPSPALPEQAGGPHQGHSLCRVTGKNRVTGTNRAPEPRCGISTRCGSRLAVGSRLPVRTGAPVRSGITVQLEGDPNVGAAGSQADAADSPPAGVVPRVTSDMSADAALHVSRRVVSRRPGSSRRRAVASMMTPGMGERVRW